MTKDELNKVIREANQQLISDGFVSEMEVNLKKCSNFDELIPALVQLNINYTNRVIFQILSKVLCKD